MSGDASVNTGAAVWPDADSAYFVVRRMQTKLYRWATEDHGRRFGDLFNLEWSHAQIFSFMRRFFLIKYYEMICIYFLRKESTSYASGQTTSHYEYVLSHFHL
jgi:hypothetical protein